MKTIVLTHPDGSNKVEVKVDIFATNAQLLTAGFDTRFTNMEIVQDDNAIGAGVGLTEIEKSWQAVVALSKAQGWALSVIDINEGANSPVTTATALAGTLAGTKGASAITGTGTNFDPELVVDSLIYIDGFVYTVDTVTDDVDADVAETFNTTFTGVTGYVIASLIA